MTFVGRILTWPSAGTLVTVIAFVIASGHRIVAADHSGHVTANGVPVPGATVIATQGERRVVSTTDIQGTYHLELADGIWMVRVEMPGFAPQAREIPIRPGAQAVAWELALLSFESITRGLPAAPPAVQPASGAARGQNPAATPASANGPAAGTDPARSAFQPAVVNRSAPEGSSVSGYAAEAPAGAVVGPEFGTADGFIINGSVNGGGSSRVGGQSDAFGNNRGIRVGSRYQLSSGFGARNSNWDAGPASFGGRPGFRTDYRNINISAMFGGPLRIPGLIRDGPPFMLSYQRYTNQSASTSTGVVPTALERVGDFSRTRDAFGRPVYVIDPVTRLPFPGNVIAQNRISPQAAALLRYYPLPNLVGGASNYERAIPTSTVRDDVWAAVNDYSVSAANRISFDFQSHRSGTQTSSLFGFDDQSRGSDLSVTVAFTHRFRRSLVRFRNTFGRQTPTTTPYFANRTNVSGEAGISGNDQEPLNWGPPALGFSSVASLSAGQYSSSRNQTNTSLVEASLTRARHSFAVGGEVRHSGIDQWAQPDPRGSFFFSGGVTGSDFADFLLGVPSTSQLAYSDAGRNFRGFSYAAFVSDDYRFGPSLTLKLGVRWEYEAPFTETHGRLANLDVAPGFLAVGPVLASGRIGPLTGRSFPDSLVAPDRRGVQPRLAVAWRPILGSSVLVRAGYGLYRNSGQYFPLAQTLAQQPPFVHVVNGLNSPDTPLTLANGFIASPTITASTDAVDPDFRASDAHVWQASVQRDLPFALTVFATYIGTRGTHLPQQFLPNTYAPGAENPCPTCPIGFVYVTSDGRSFRQAAEVQIRRRLHNGLTFSAQYTLAKATDDAATFSGIRGRSAQNWREPDAERALSNEDRRHQLGGQVQYTSGGADTTGEGLRDRVTEALFSGWTITSRVLIGSGVPLTPLYRTALPGTATNGTVRASLTGAPVDDVPAGHYLNPLAYTIPPAGQWGDAGRNSIRGPRQFSLDAGVTRSFSVTERCSVEWRVDVTNMLNRVTYSSVNTTVNSTQFGLPTSTNDMRKLQTALRLRLRF